MKLLLLRFVRADEAQDLVEYALLITFIVSYIFFGIEEIGVEIEDPFEIDDNDLPLDRICDGIAANVTAFNPKAS